MFNKIKKFPIGIITLCAVSVIGMKDTGTIVKNHIQTAYSGNKIEFNVGEKVEVVEKTNDGYIVAKGKARVTIPVEKVLIDGLDEYKVTKNTTIKNNGNVLRTLFIGEELVLVEDKGEGVIVKAKDDNSVGYVSKDALELSFKGKSTIKDNTTSEVIKMEALDKEEDEITKIAASAKVNVKAKVETEKVVKITNNTEELNVTDKVNSAVDSALSKLGTPYVYGKTGNGGYDCSGLVYAVYKNEFGINLPRSSREQSTFGQQIEINDIKKGDLIFFNTTGNGVSHVGIYMGSGEFVHASSGKGKVVVSNLNDGYYGQRVVNATRVIK